MIKNIECLTSNYDGIPLEVLTVRPHKAPRAVLVMAHGMSEHKERYVYVMESLAKSGYACVMADMRGHGKSLMKEKDLGFFYDSGLQGVIKDLHQIVYYAKEQFPDAPVILFGHSMGTLVAQAYMKQHDFGLDGVILSGAPCLNQAAAFARMLTESLAGKSGRRQKSGLLDNMTIGNYEKVFKKEGRKHAWLAVNTAVSDAYEADPLSGFSFTLDGYDTLFRLMESVGDEKNWDVTKYDLPILYIAGMEDPVIGGVRGFRDSVHAMRGHGYQRVRGKLYAGYRHEILQDYCRDEVLSDMKRWIFKEIIKRKQV